MKRHYYNCSALEDFIAKMEREHKYNCVQTWEGSLGIGNWILVSPDDRHCNFITRIIKLLREEYLNDCSSIHSMMKCSVLPDKYKKELENYYLSEETEEV